MADERELKQAKATFATLCKYLDDKGWKYDVDDTSEDRLTIKSGAATNDFPVEFRVIVDADRMLVSYLSILPFRAPEDKLIDMALATTVANYGIVDGSFDFNIETGNIIFRLTSSFRESLLGTELFEYMIIVATSTVDAYNDKFFMLSKGMLSIEDFIKAENQ